MGKKDNTLLWVGGGLLVGWFLAPKELKDQITGGMPSVGIDLSNLFGGLDLGGLLPEGGEIVPTIIENIINEFKIPEFDISKFDFSDFLPDFKFPDWPIPESGNTAYSRECRCNR